MVIIKNKVSLKSEEILFIASYMKVYSDFNNNYVVIQFNNGIKIYLKFNVFDTAYPNNSLKYYESYLLSTLMEFIRDHKRNMKVRMLSNVKGDIANISLEVSDYSYSKRNIPVSVDVFIEMSAEKEETIKVSYDDLRDALIISLRDGVCNKEILIGTPGKEIKMEWQYDKNIKITKDKNIFKHIATLKTTLNKDIPVLDLYISDDIDRYDSAYLIFSPVEQKEEIVDINNTSIKRIYNYFYAYLKHAIFSNKFYEVLRDYYLYRRINRKLLKEYEKSLSKDMKIFVDDLQGKKVSWMEGADENILGRSLYHTLLLSNKLIDEGHYREGYNLLETFSNTFYDIINFSLIDKLKSENKIVEMMFLFIRAFNKLFLNIKISNSGKVFHAFYLPRNIEHVEFNNVRLYENLQIPSLNIYNYASKIEYEIEFMLNKKISNYHVKIIKDEKIIEKDFKLKGENAYYLNAYLY